MPPNRGQICAGCTIIGLLGRGEVDLPSLGLPFLP